MLRPWIVCIASLELLEIVRTILPPDEYNIVTMGSASHHLEAVLAEPPALFIIELATDRPATWIFLELLHSELATHHIPVILVSKEPAVLEYARRQQAVYGGDAYIVMPHEAEVLRSVVISLLQTTHR